MRTRRKNKSKAALINAIVGENCQWKPLKGHCKECGVYGHTNKDCWEHKENAHKRPYGKKSRKRQDKVEVSRVDLCLASLTRSQDFGSAR